MNVKEQPHDLMSEDDVAKNAASHQPSSPDKFSPRSGGSDDEFALELIETGEDGLFLVSGNIEALGAPVIPLTVVPASSRWSTTDLWSMGLGGANAAAQAAHAISSAHGLVRLAPDTIAALQAGAQPLTSGGWNLGTLAAGGKISHAVRWTSAGSQAGVAVLASLGPAAALLAIQYQLAQISSLVKENIALTRTVLRSIGLEQWARSKAHFESLAKELGHAQAIGEVTPQIWQQVQAQGSETILREQLDIALENTAGSRRALDQITAAKERRDWLQDNAQTIVQATQSLLMAEHAWFLYQALRAASLQNAAATDEKAALLQRRIVAGAREQHDRVASVVTSLLSELHGLLRLVEESPGSLGMTLLNRAKTREEVRGAAQSLAAQLASLAVDRERFSADPPGRYPLIPLTAPEHDEELARRLRWVLTADERLITTMRSAGFWWYTRFLAFTSERVLILEESSFLSRGDIERQLPWSAVHSVSKVEGSDHDDGFDLQIRFSEDPAGVSEWSFPLRGDSLTHQGDEVLQLLSGHTRPPNTESSNAQDKAITLYP
ncbi:hypothetical protein [Modestobacter excelsi]|uniref:hypothetical protein n=1 Tax=Modestobacter excelsi TaxID=2213161 RepID=UPI00110CA5D9|nr:hypothetical protein [Modestobacter excelsi]